MVIINYFFQFLRKEEMILLVGTATASKSAVCNRKLTNPIITTIILLDNSILLKLPIASGLKSRKR